ncbi:hypothetical protein KJ059_09895 [Myxococcota bacterium]|nr:hypothetical protein [Myxococcota bacterium]
MAPLEVLVERLGLRLRFGWAFHAREVRFERVRESEAGPPPIATPLFAETFSFHVEHHDPLELHLQLEDLWSDPRRIGEGATRREAQEALSRLLAGVPAYLERLLDALEAAPLPAAASVRIHADLIALAREISGFLEEKKLTAQPSLRLAVLHLRKLVFRGSRVLVRERVTPAVLDAWLAGAAISTASRGASSRMLLQLIAVPQDARADALLLDLGARAFHEWLEDTCLDESNEAFEGEDSPFGTREQEVLAAAVIEPAGRLRRAAHLSPFLRRLASRDCQRLLRKLEVWFLRRYDVPRAAAVIRHAENLARGQARFGGVLSWHSTQAYCAAIVALIWPFVGAAAAYDRAPFFFDAACTLQLIAVMGVVLWYLLIRFIVQKDLSFFHGAVPRIGAGIIVGYLPVFLIDEVWDLARRPWFPLGVTVTLLGFMTLLYLYAEVRRRIPDPQEAFSRARRIWLLGILQALALGVVVTTLLGGFMVSRTWSAEPGVSMEVLRATTPPFLGELPRIMGLEPVYAFPTAILLMTFLSLFIGTFLQLLWEDLPITEPL